MNKVLSVLITVIAFLGVAGIFGVTKANAKEVCFSQYGGGETCVNVDESADIELDKTIRNPKSGQYEDHIKATGGSYPYVFKSDETIKFRITVKNTGDVELKNVKVKDVLPTFLKYDSGDGDSSNDGKEVKFDGVDLDPDEEKTFTFTAKIDSDGIDPDADKVCLTNIATVKGERSDDSDKKEEAVDYANFCITFGKVLGKESPKVLPTTGFGVGYKEVFAASLAGGLMLVGFGLKKFAE